MFSSLQMMGIRKYHCTGWPDEHSNIHCASICMMAITRKLHLLHFSRNEGMPSIPEKWSGRYTHLIPMWFPNAADFQNWGYTLNSGNLASQASPAKKTSLLGGLNTKKVDQTIFFVKCIHIKIHFAKKLGQNGHSSPQQWSEQSTDAHRGLPPPTRWSSQKSKYQYRDHLVGRLTTKPHKFSRNVFCRLFLWPLGLPILPATCLP